MVPHIAKFAFSLLLLTCFMLLAGFTAQAQKSIGGTTSSINSEQREMVLAPRAWTREEMLAAKPMPMPEPARMPSDGYQLSVRPSGPPVSEPGGLPVGSGQVATAETTEENLVREMLFGPEPTAAPAFTYPFPYSRYENQPAADYIQWPYRTIGKVFFTKFSGGNFVCSASSIGNYAVITAGHCVSDGLGHFHTNWVFVPRYYNGSAPDGQWSANMLIVNSAWHNGGANDWQVDFGGAILNKLGGLKISQKVGFLGWAANLPLQQVWHSIGYPAVAPFTGKYQVICATAYAVTDIVVGSNQTFGFGCDATGGTSGGPVIRKFAKGPLVNTSQVNGVNSYKYLTGPTAKPQALYSPWFGTTAVNHINCLKNSGPGIFKCTGPPAP